MSMSPDYQSLLQQAKQLQNTFRDLLDEHNPTAVNLENEMKHLIGDIENQRPPRSIEADVVNVDNHMRNIEHQGDSLMNYSHANALISTLDHMREFVRRLPNY